MPMYSYVCTACERKSRRFLPVARYLEPQYCENPNCPQNGMLESSNPMTKIIEAPAVVGDYEGYISPATGQWVEGRAQHLEDLKRSGCRILEPGESKDEPRKAKERLAKLEKEIEQAVDKTAGELGISQ